MPSEVGATPSLRDVVEVRLGTAVGVLFATTAVMTALGVPTAAAVTVGLVQTGLSCAALERRSAALFAGLVGWALCTGFGVNRLGLLTFSGRDLARMVAFVACAQAGLVAHDTMAAVRAARRRRDGRSHAERPTTGVGVRRRSAGALAGRAGPRSAA